MTRNDPSDTISTSTSPSPLPSRCRFMMPMHGVGALWVLEQGTNTHNGEASLNPLTYPHAPGWRLAALPGGRSL